MQIRITIKIQSFVPWRMRRIFAEFYENRLSSIFA